MPQNIVVTLESKEAFEWMKTLIENTIDSPNSKPMLSSPQHVIAWQEALSQAKVEKQTTQDSTPKKTSTKKKTASRKKKKTAATKKQKVDTSGLVCNDHPKYGAIRPPRTDCKACWDVYEKLNGKHTRDQKYRMFKLKQKNK